MPNAIVEMVAEIHNAFLVQKKLNNNKTTYKKFLLSIAIALLEGHEIQDLGTEEAELSITIEKTRAASRLTRLLQDFKKHKLVPIVMSGKNIYIYIYIHIYIYTYIYIYPHQKCRICSTNEKSGYTRHICQYCKVPLHKLICFERFDYTLQKY